MTGANISKDAHVYPVEIKEHHSIVSEPESEYIFPFTPKKPKGKGQSCRIDSKDYL